MRSTHRILAAVAAPAALLAAAAPAHAAAISPLRPCYVSINPAEREYLHAVATGFRPNAEVKVDVNGVSASAVADSTGTVDLRRTAAPFRQRGQAPFAVTVTDSVTGLTATASAWVTALAVHVRPKDANTSDRVRFAGRGFTAQRGIWGHYVLHGRVRRTVRLARRPSSPCGTFSVRRRQFPMRHVRPGLWTLQIDQQRHWSAHPRTVSQPIRIRVRRVIGSP